MEKLENKERFPLSHATAATKYKDLNVKLVALRV